MLVRLELENFKSYRGHHVIGPLTSFSCIIGPNGAGKSNVMDAISFVLGVKSMQLRSSTLRELIYRPGRMDPEAANEGNDSDGSAAPTRCHVLAVILDRNGEEMLFKRSVTAGGSEYRINDEAVPYARYNETLESLNIMVKARNFLVFQGDVEAIASQSSRDLTRLIEQVSGSDELKNEYELLKEKQDRAAENSTFNFNKKRGITAEMKQYKEQREEAAKFERMLKAKDELVIEHMVWKLFHIYSRMGAAAADVGKHTAALAEKQEQQKQLEIDLNDLKVKQAQLQKESLKTDRMVALKQKDVTSRGAELLKIEEQSSHLSKKLKTLDESRRKLLTEKAVLVEEIDSLSTQLGAVKEAASVLDEQIRQTAAKAAKISLTKEQLHEYAQLREKANAALVEENQKIKAWQRQESAVKDEISRAEEKLADIDRRKGKLTDDDKSIIQDKKKLEETLAALSREVAAAKEKLDTYQQRRSYLQQREMETEEQLAAVYQQLSQARYDQTESEHKVRLRDAIDTMKRVYSGVHGKLIDLCRPTQRKYDTAVSIVLGKHLDSIVVDTSQTAIECIQFLKEQQVGVATFLPLESLHVKPVNEKYRQIAKGARLAVDVLQYDPAVERAVEYSCGNALVCDTLQIARHVCFDKQQRVKAVTLDGTVIHKVGMITGGTTDSLASGSRRWERKELEQLSVRKTQLEQQLGDLSHERRMGASDQVLRATIHDLETKHRLAGEDLTTADRRLASIVTELEFVEKERAQSLGSLHEFRGSLAELCRQHDQVKESIRKREAIVFKDFCKQLKISSIDEYESQQLHLHQEDNEKKLRFATQISRLEAELQFSREQLAKMETRESYLNKQHAAESANLVRLEEQREKIIELNKAVYEEIESLRKDKASAHDACARLGADVSILKNMLHTCNASIQHINKTMAGQESLMEKLAAERGDIFRRCKLEEIAIPLVRGVLEDIPMEDSERTSRGDSMDMDGPSVVNDEVEVDFSGLSQELQESDSPEAVEADFTERIKAAVSDIERMHPNLKANERLDGVEARMRETNDEFDRVRKEAKAVRDQFLKVKQQRYDRFYKAYGHISTRIDEIYKELTKSQTHPLGGTAYLTLENSDEPYLEGVKYHAMPPMKRFRDMEQLSGGEKTMAALALLFAVHSYHPSPFFVLDEVDAALDNANVAKIARYLRTNAADVFQFLVISLKSSLYECSESLVGIYRDLNEKSSAVLTLDLTQYAEG